MRGVLGRVGRGVQAPDGRIQHAGVERLVGARRIARQRGGQAGAQQQGNTSNATNALTEVNPEVLSVDAKAVYDTIYKSMQSSMFQELSQSGVNAFDDANYTEAIDKLSKAKNINDSDYTVLNYLAHAYRLSGDTDNAISVFQEIIDKFPGTQKATKAEQQIEALGGTVKTEE